MSHSNVNIIKSRQSKPNKSEAEDFKKKDGDKKPSKRKLSHREIWKAIE